MNFDMLKAAGCSLEVTQNAFSVSFIRFESSIEHVDSFCLFSYSQVLVHERVSRKIRNSRPRLCFRGPAVISICRAPCPDPTDNSQSSTCSDCLQNVDSTNSSKSPVYTERSPSILSTTLSTTPKDVLIIQQPRLTSHFHQVQTIPSITRADYPLPTKQQTPQSGQRRDPSPASKTIQTPLDSQNHTLPSPLANRTPSHSLNTPLTSIIQLMTLFSSLPPERTPLNSHPFRPLRRDSSHNLSLWLGPNMRPLFRRHTQRIRLPVIKSQMAPILRLHGRANRMSFLGLQTRSRTM